ncbi:MAG: TIGR03618 family F420-dependent PPOX class oxidoreductase [Acidimicrobiales bacterium]|nr:TIGR03618 family F420-dependent PPOX class oxidoreductase [Acidimicrobiales bacterium]
MSDILTDVPESHRDILRKTLTATLSTVDAKGRPRSTAIWYFVDSDGQLKGSTTSDRYQYKDLRRDPNCDLFIIDSNPFRTLEVRAEAKLLADPDKATVRKLAKVYGLDEAMLVRAEEDRYTVTYRPRKLVALHYELEDFLHGPRR